ncbi:E3 ubiquitin-protein ligase ATL6 [Dichanthelium oligosanthes]|uniref:RING-type E3 ubiquitin transferase n=1 Tax=Dichanthelium oligosanthes TaxID=888268 RepID=A0A1E5V327_9POAL|nr:E3 ubiquitin-protein ligase ATL6 [Dichanthelium oligosanthes]
MGASNGQRLLLLVAGALAGAAVDSVAAQQSPPSGPGPSYFDPKNFNPSMAIVMVVLVTAFFLLGFFSIYLRRCAGPPLGGPDEYPVGARLPGIGITYASRSSRRARGLDRAILESFPTMAYADVKAHKAGKGALECAVCLSEFDNDETLRLLPRCAHVFHADCIDAWLASHVTCPVCRAVLAPDYEAPAPDLVPPSAVPMTEHDAPAVPHLPPQEMATTTAPEQAVVVSVVDAEETEEERIRREEAAELMRIGSVKRALRNKSGRRPAQFPRSHTTGHSLAAPAPFAAEASERYTLRLPEHVLREVVAAGNLRRSASVQAGGGDGSVRRGFGGARAGRSVRLGSSGRWPNMSQLARTFSARLPAWGSARRGEADAPAKGGKAVEQCDGGACPLGAHV